MFGRRPSEEDLFALVEDRRGYYRKKNADEGRRQFLINSFQTGTLSFKCLIDGSSVGSPFQA